MSSLPVCGESRSTALACLFYNAFVKTWDVIIIGGGIIGLSLSIALRKRGATVLVVERGEPGREASHAAGGMLVDCPLETPQPFSRSRRPARSMYPEFAHELELESGMQVDLRDQGTILLPVGDSVHESSDPQEIAELAPEITDCAGLWPGFT